jgi:hypothetical protein
MFINVFELMYFNDSLCQARKLIFDTLMTLPCQ